MSTGKRLAGLLLLTSSFTFPSLAYAQDEGTNQSAQEAEDPLAQAVGAVEEDQDEEPEVSVPGGSIIVTGRRARDPVRGSTQVLNVLTTEDIARTGEGDIAGALSRVTGLSVVGDGRVFVRGLGDRYSLALLNGLPLPSPEPLSRVVPLDIFPTNVVASSLVQKTYSPNYPGEFGGGVINLTTRAVPVENFLTVSMSGEFDSETTFENGLTYFGSDWDSLGFDNGNRDTPSFLQQAIDSGTPLDQLPLSASPTDPTALTREAIAGQLMPTNLVTLQRVDNQRPNFSANITGGLALEVGDGTYLGIIATGGISNQLQNRSVRNQRASIDDFSFVTEDSTNFITDENVLVNGMLSFGLDFGENTIRWTNLYIRDTLKTARLSEGFDVTLGSQDGADLQRQQTAWFERQLIDTQLVGEFEFGDGAFELDTRLGYARTDREAPYNTEILYARSNDTTPDEPADSERNVLGSNFVAYFDGDNEFYDHSISFDDLQEENYAGGIDLTWSAVEGFDVTVGYSYSDTDRRSESRIYAPLIRPDQTTEVDFNPALLGLQPPGDIINGATLAGFNVDVLDFVDFPIFDALLEVHGAYGQVRWVPSDTLTVDIGVRYEDAVQRVTLPEGTAQSTIVPVETNLENDYFLPGGTITWEVIPDLQLRFSASQTIARPQFRELVDQIYFDPVSNRDFRGNAQLIDSEFLNLETRAEYYLGGKNRVSLAGFYKDIENPIEPIILGGSGTGDLTTTYANAPEATLFGAEFELVYGFDITSLGGFFSTKDLLIIANYTFTDSELGIPDPDALVPTVVGDVPVSIVFEEGNPLVGQSDHVANFQIGFEDFEKTQQAFFLFNYASERVTTRGFATPDVVEDPGLTVDFVARSDISPLGLPVEVSLEVRNIFGRDNFEFLENETGRIEVNTFEVGTRVQLGVQARF
ncbi:MAG: TonB-dependent receptor [Erythrobacter sp.]|uniref:TonB-dependent receptor domain-containing protein n=1 Tax=Erythrobacter sp. TaxID=1042 RepID=UPI0026315DF2|nr:TonB-dependent receptor [Erythrobacter sp.]MDJ0978600.1 TonB-dependent receptor [Erythrobacter sp.]